MKDPLTDTEATNSSQYKISNEYVEGQGAELINLQVEEGSVLRPRVESVSGAGWVATRRAGAPLSVAQPVKRGAPRSKACAEAWSEYGGMKTRRRR